MMRVDARGAARARYFRPATLAVMDTVLELRKSSALAFYTMDAGHTSRC
jgi:mevalonate pyrophosphate decarboxylase